MPSSLHWPRVPGLISLSATIIMLHYDLNLQTNTNPNEILSSCVKYIDEVKTGPFAEHSNQLWNVSGVPTWSKVTFINVK